MQTSMLLLLGVALAFHEPSADAPANYAARQVATMGEPEHA